MNKTILISLLIVTLYPLSAYALESCAELNAGTNTLTADITADLDPCFNFLESDIELDCQGHTIDGSSSVTTAMYMDSVQNIVIKNCTIKNFAVYGLYVFGVSDSVFEDIIIQDINDEFDTPGYGIVGENVYSSVFRRIFVEGSSMDGIDLYNCTNNEFSNITSTANEEMGIYVEASSFNTFDTLAIFNNILDGILLILNGETLISSQNNQITNSNIYNNGDGINTAGVTLIGSDTNTFYNNFFNNSLNVILDPGYINTWDTNTLDCETSNIIDGACIGGNFWATPAGDGFSETCLEETNGICVTTYTLDDDNIDALPLVYSQPAETDNQPTVTLYSPENNNISSTHEITFNCSAEDDYALVSMTLFGNWTGVWQENETVDIFGTANSTVFTKNINDGTYIWNCLVYDNSSNADWYETNFMLTIDATAPVISSVINESITNTSSVITWTTDENSNSRVDFGSTTDLTDGFNSSETLSTFHSITLNNLINNTVYYYNVTSCDTLNNCNQIGPYEFTTAIYNSDDSPPVITLISPANASTWTESGTVTFSYNVTDENSINCSLILNNEVDQTNSSVTQGTTITFTKSLSNANYNWSITCTDGNNTGNSETYILTVSYFPPVVVPPTTSSSSGGGSGGSFRATPALDANTSLKNWYTLASNTQVTWTINKSTVTALELHTGTQSSNAALLVKELNQKPSFLPDAGQVYKYLNITSTNLNLKETTIVFKVEKSWIKERDIILARYTTKWIELPTEESGSDALYKYYKAITPGFSYFAVTAREKEIIPEPETQSSTPAEGTPEIKSQEPPETTPESVTAQEQELISDNRVISDTIFGIIILVLAAVLVIGLIVKFYPRIRNL